MTASVLAFLAAAPPASSSVSPYFLVISALAAAAGSVAGALGTWLGMRRKASGRIGTSEADVLWQQASSMRDSLSAQLDKVTEQRDRLIESQSAQILPLVSGIIETLKQLGAAISVIIGHAEAELARDARVLKLLTANQSALARVLERLDHDEVLQIQGTARPVGARPVSPARKGHGDRPAGEAGGTAGS